MQITKKWLGDKNACHSAYTLFKKQEREFIDSSEILDWCINNNRYSWASWLLARMFKTKKQKVLYAIFSAELVINIFEKNHKSTAPRKAINAAKAYLKTPSRKTKNAAAAAADAAYAAYDAAAYDAAAYAAAYAAYAAAAAAADADDAADAAADAAKKDIYQKIITYGRSLL